MALTTLTVPLKVSGQTPDSRIKDLVVTACNTDDDTAASGVLTLDGTYLTQGVAPESFVKPFAGLLPGACETATFVWTAPSVGTSVTWTAEVSVTGDITDPNPANDTKTGTTLVYPFRK